MIIGYARVSTEDQNLNFQKDALSKAGCEKLFSERLSGIKKERPKLKEALNFAKKGDTILVWRLDRLSRSLKDLIEISTFLEKKGINLKTIQEHIDTKSISGKFFFHIFGALAEFESSLIRERTVAGLTAAKKRGKIGGRPNILDEKKKNILIKLYEKKNYTITKICEMMKISRPTLYKYTQSAIRRKEKIYS